MMSEIREHDSKIYFSVKPKVKKSETFFKFVSPFLLLGILFFASFDVFSATCQQLFYTEDGSGGRPYKAYYTDNVIPAKECSDYVVMTSEEFFSYNFYAEQFGEVDPISPGQIAESFTWGFGTYIGFWFLGYVIRNAKQVIKLA